MHPGPTDSVRGTGGADCWTREGTDESTRELLGRLKCSTTDHDDIRNPVAGELDTVP